MNGEVPVMGWAFYVFGSGIIVCAVIVVISILRGRNKK